ncbi:unnamed protein product [Linum tenue]|uniref:non-specific serine/threonine protein kinase n=1 Tax=Linum tenue TaxID=586396 RepID=A0AAV0M4F7_9ROSI|nr:unnamed protein product [Linum tenue]
MGLQGTLPPHIGNLSFLLSLDLSDNLLGGDLPMELSKLRRLKTINLSTNRFGGTIPWSLGGLSGLRELDLGHNRLSGAIPTTIFNISSLETLILARNWFTGTIPKSIGNLTALTFLSLGETNLTGEIPSVISNLRRLEILRLWDAGLSGTIPSAIFNITTLQVVDLSTNTLSGILPDDLFSRAPNLEQLRLFDNQLQGAIPKSIGDCASLVGVELSTNQFSGRIPTTIGNCTMLEWLFVAETKLTGDNGDLVVPPSFLASLTKCTHLEVLEFSSTLVEAALPSSIGNLSSSMVRIQAQKCGLIGYIPDAVGNLSNLVGLDLSSNRLSGSIPRAIRRLRKLQGLALDGNELHGPIPDELCELQALVELSLNNNSLSQQVPECLAKLTSLQALYLQSNQFSSAIPSSFWNQRSLITLNMAGNRLNGHLPPHISNLKALVEMNLARNRLSGDIPASIGGLVNLQYLYMDQNHFQGPIPDTLASIVTLKSLDLSSNNLSSSIPKSLESLRDLQYFNVSHNQLWGEIPSKGSFEQFSSDSFKGNPALCGLPKFGFPSCPQPRGKKRGQKHLLIKLLILLILFLVVVAIAALFVVMICCRKRKVDERSNGREESPLTKWRRISLLELQRATNGFDDCNLLGKGSFGRVYKGELADGIDVAVKVFNDLEEEEEEEEAECEILCNLRHRNLIKIVSICYTIDFKALVLEFMPNGSLEKWLYSHNYFLNILQRLNIVIDVASALEYLHHGYSIPIVHCDVKPENVLLDGDLVARLSDFGISKLLGGIDSITRTLMLGTIGYIAPEFGGEGVVSIKSDVYSFGILLMEVFTRRKPTEESFDKGMDMKQWVTALLPERVTELVDANLLVDEARINLKAKVDCILSIMKLALACCIDTPKDRMDIRDVLSNLKKIKSQISKPRHLRI